MECKSGHKDRDQRNTLKGYRDEFFKKAAVFARSHPTIYFVVTFVSECLQEEAVPASMPTNMTTAVRVVTSGDCPFISHLIGVDFDDNKNYAAACANFDKEKRVKVEVSDEGGSLLPPLVPQSPYCFTIGFECIFKIRLVPLGPLLFFL